MTELSALYYPFSRCVSPASLKQLLLVFDEVSFVDPVEDDRWRTKLFQDLEVHDQQFSQYHDIHPSLPDLIDHGCIRRIDPKKFTAKERILATASALSDLQDDGWLNVASNPKKFRMPAIEIHGRPSWQVFLPKLPKGFLGALYDDPQLQQHLLLEVSELGSWSLSYAAGSAIGINLHLEIAEELGVAPVTDSELHHRLLLMKIARATGITDKSVPIPDDVIHHLTTNIASTMLAEVMPDDRLRDVTFEQIISFRESTKIIRKHFISDIEARLGQLRTVPNSQEWIMAGRQILFEFRNDLQQYQAEFVSSRDKIWPGILSSLNRALVSGSVGAVAMSFIGGPGKALIGSIVGASIGVLKTTLDWRTESRKLLNASAPSIAYISKVAAHIS